MTELARMRTAADWLSARPQLGLQVFARGQMKRQSRPQAELYVAFLKATLAMLGGKAEQPAQAPPTSRRRSSFRVCQRPSPR